MNPPLRLALCAVLLSSLWTACGPSEPNVPGKPVDTPTGSCQVDQDCPDPGLFFCDTVTSRCQAACRTQEDCTAEKRGEYRIAECEGNPLGCRCDNSRCRVAQCSADAECAVSGQVCRNGRCGAAPEASAVTACRVTPEYVVGREGTSARFSVLAMDAAGRAVVVPSGAAWTALDESVDGGGTGVESTFVLTEATVGARELVQAKVGGATCTARVSVLGAAVVSGQLRAVVRDELTGRPIDGAAVVVADGKGAVTATATTDASGVVTLAAPAEAGSVSVFHQAFSYLTVAHEGPGGPMDLALPLRRNPTDRYGGYKGTFRNMPASQDMHTGIVGLSAPDAVTDLSASLVTGPVRRVAFTMGGQAREATLPAGAYVVLPGSTLQVTDVSTQGLAGVCGTEASVTSGACGTRTAWALGGDIPLNALPLLSGGTMDVGQLLAQTIPLLRTFSSSVVRDVEFGLEVTPRNADTDAPDYGDQKHFATVDHDFQTDQRMELGFQFAVRVPDLPPYRGAWMDSAAVLGAVRVPGRGVVPLGLGMGVNTNPVDPKTDTQVGLPGPGLVSMRMAPAHHGLEGSPYELMITASSSAATDATAGAASSALIHRTLEKLPFDPKGGTPVAVSGPFLPTPEGARYNYNQVAARGLEGRQLRFIAAPVLPAATVLRAMFTDRKEHRWVVLMDVARAATGVRLPVPPTGFEDRTYYGDTVGSRSPLGMQALVVRRTGTSSGTAVNLHGLVDADGVDLEHLGELTVAWSALDYGRPLVRWVEPAEDGQLVGRGSKVKVRVSFFRVGSNPVEDDGYVRLTFAGGTGCEGQVPGNVVDAQGQVELLLPMNCTGTGVELTATLVDTAGVELSPPVWSKRTLTIN
ncbi:dickkopf-related protein [Archangium lansingense]|uniref:Dickkopf-related protein n=1 Tax=Archangium lansingense TaxID=2995310 RepID=A0ABT4ABE7_9BACT|nr:dickkopf-related protein [Archangium lansinium]MCY1079005.1 dickkopf-related protein [Archangium lansinium]